MIPSLLSTRRCVLCSHARAPTDHSISATLLSSCLWRIRVPSPSSVELQTKKGSIVRSGSLKPSLQMTKVDGETTTWLSEYNHEAVRRQPSSVDGLDPSANDQRRHPHTTSGASEGPIRRRPSGATRTRPVAPSAVGLCGHPWTILEP